MNSSRSVEIDFRLMGFDFGFLHEIRRPRWHPSCEIWAAQGIARSRFPEITRLRTHLIHALHTTISCTEICGSSAGLGNGVGCGKNVGRFATTVAICSDVCNDFCSVLCVFCTRAVSKHTEADTAVVVSVRTLNRSHSMGIHPKRVEGGTRKRGTVRHYWQSS